MNYLKLFAVSTLSINANGTYNLNTSLVTAAHKKAARGMVASLRDKSYSHHRVAVVEAPAFLIELISNAEISRNRFAVPTEGKLPRYVAPVVDIEATRRDSRSRQCQPKRKYDDQIHTTVKALDAIYGDETGLRAFRKLLTKWPDKNWPAELAAIFCAVLFEPPPLGLPAPGGNAQ